MQHDLNLLHNWLKVHSLKLNVLKTKCLLFNKDGLFPKIDITIDNEVIESVTSFKFLGVLLNSALSFNAHYAELYAKLQKGVYIVRSLSRVLPLSSLRPLYFAYFHSYLSYGLTAWYSNLSSSQQAGLFMLQKRVVRALGNATFRQHCMPIFRNLKILTLEDQYKLDNLKLMFRVSKNTAPLSIVKMFKQGVSQRLHVPKHRTTMLNRSFLCKPIMEWQKITK